MTIENWRLTTDDDDDGDDDDDDDDQPHAVFCLLKCEALIGGLLGW